MSTRLEITYLGRPSCFHLEPLDRKRLLGDTRLLALDAEGKECRTAHLTRDGKYLLLPGSTADMYVDADGNWVDRNTLTRADGAASLEASAAGPVELEGPVPVQELLDGVATRVHRLEAEALHPALDAALREGAVFRLKGPPAAGVIYLFANDAGIFLVHAEPAGFAFVGPDQLLTETAFAGDGDDAIDPFAFDDTMEAQR
jgi:hypothetical protein